MALHSFSLLAKPHHHYSAALDPPLPISAWLRSVTCPSLSTTSCGCTAENTQHCPSASPWFPCCDSHSWPLSPSPAPLAELRMEDVHLEGAKQGWLRCLLEQNPLKDTSHPGNAQLSSAQAWRSDKEHHRNPSQTALSLPVLSVCSRKWVLQLRVHPWGLFSSCRMLTDLPQPVLKVLQCQRQCVLNLAICLD